jgi:hypothetical protein
MERSEGITAARFHLLNNCGMLSNPDWRADCASTGGGTLVQIALRHTALLRFADELGQ